MTAVLYLLNVLCSCGQSTLGKLYARRGGNAAVFNANKAIAGAAVFLLAGLIRGLHAHWASWGFGLAYGVALCISMHTGFRALATGPIALTSIIASFSLIIPFLFGIAVWQESLTVGGGFGIALLLAAIALLGGRREGGLSLRWSLYALATLAANGVCSLIQKYHQLAYPGLYRTEFMLAALATVLALSIGMHGVQKPRPPFALSGVGLCSGVMNGAANYIVLYLAATEKASVLFPMVSVANAIAVWLVGRFLFREKLRPLQAVGLLCGIAAVWLLNTQ